MTDQLSAQAPKSDKAKPGLAGELSLNTRKSGEGKPGPLESPVRASSDGSKPQKGSFAKAKSGELPAEPATPRTGVASTPNSAASSPTAGPQVSSDTRVEPLAPWSLPIRPGCSDLPLWSTVRESWQLSVPLPGQASPARPVLPYLPQGSSGNQDLARREDSWSCSDLLWCKCARPVGSVNALSSVFKARSGCTCALLSMLWQQSAQCSTSQYCCLQRLERSSRSLDAALMREMPSSRRSSIAGGPEGAATGPGAADGLGKPPSGKEGDGQSQEELREKLRIVKVLLTAGLLITGSLRYHVKACAYAPGQQAQLC